MKRDMDLARKILLEIEAHPEPYDAKLNIAGHSEEEIAYHIKLLYQAGLIEAHNLESFGSFEWSAESLTWEGHEFLDACRDDSRWAKRNVSMILRHPGSIISVSL